MLFRVRPGNQCVGWVICGKTAEERCERGNALSGRLVRVLGGLIVKNEGV